MARIRSIFPNQWTDDAFVSCSPLARLLSIALRNEADDQGVFEWKPVVLKMRLLPGDSVDIAPLLDELFSTRQIIKFVEGERSYGAIRNFMLWQRPKKPSALHPCSGAVSEWVAMNRRKSPTSTEPVPNEGGTGTEPVRNQPGNRSADRRRDIGGGNKSLSREGTLSVGDRGNGANPSDSDDEYPFDEFTGEVP